MKHLVILGMAMSALAQQPGREFDPLNRTVSSTSIEALLQFEAEEEKDYRIGEGDEIVVAVWGGRS